MANAYAFRGLVGLNTAAGTVYIPASEAAALARDLARIAAGVAAGQWPDQGPARADFPTDRVGTALDVAAALGKGLIKTRPGPDADTWQGMWRKTSKGRFWPVSGPSGPICYTSPRDALRGACWALSHTS